MRITEKAIRAAVRRSLRESLEEGRINHKELEEMMLANSSTVSKIGELIQLLREKIKQDNPITQEEVDNAVAGWQDLLADPGEEVEIDFSEFVQSDLIGSRNYALSHEEREKIAAYREIDKIVVMLLIFMKKIYRDAGLDFPGYLTGSEVMQILKREVASVALRPYDYDDIVDMLPIGSSEREAVLNAAEMSGAGNTDELGKQAIRHANYVMISIADKDNSFLSHLDDT